ncbi:MAG: hypothetical protein V4668_04600 [Patescibacteria group bacterium]
MRITPTERNKPMKKLLLVTALCFPTLGQAATEECTVQTFDAKGVYLATVQTGDGQPLNAMEAAEVTDLLNARHNTGTNPVRAKMSCS